MAFTSSEILAISNFSAAGGTLFLLGDASGFAAARDANLNLLLTGIGSSLRIVPDSIDVGFRFAGSSHIAADPLTAGVSSFTYTYVAAVSGGTSLFTASGGQTFVAATGEIRVVPEPSTVVLLASALGMLAAFTARRNVRGRRVSSRTRDCA